MYQLNEKIRDLKPYDPICGDYAIRLDANESFLPLPEKLLQKLQQAVENTAFHRYPDPTSARLCRAFAAHYGVDEALVTAGNGSDELISIICTAFLMKGDAFVTLEPDFSMYRFYGTLAEGRAVSYCKGDGLVINVDEVIRQANSENAKLILFSNPCNPTSLGLSREEVRRLIRGVSALVVLDEAYMDFWDQSLLSETEQYDNLIILRTCSKAFGMAAVRLGFAVANPVLTNALRAVKSPYNVNSLSQAAGAVLLNEQELTHTALEQILHSRRELECGMQKLQKEKPGAFILFASCTNFVFLRMRNAQGVYRELLNRGIAVRHMGEHLRITAGTPQENSAVLQSFMKIL